jgi:endothelin-converting enzyme
LPADKGSFGQFESLADQNKQVIRKILEAPTIKPASTTDEKILAKLRDFYSSCTNEDHLDKLGQAPIQPIIKHLRQLYKGNVSHTFSETERKTSGLTAAVAYLHSLGIGYLN